MASSLSRLPSSISRTNWHQNSKNKDVIPLAFLIRPLPGIKSEATLPYSALFCGVTIDIAATDLHV